MNPTPHWHRCLILAVFLLYTALLSTGLPALAQPAIEYPEDIARRLQIRYDAMHSLSFTFNQRVEGDMSGRPQTGSGEAFFLKQQEQSRMRWNYQTPSQQVLISDGRTFSLYFAELRQMIVTSAASLDQELIYSFFSGRGELQRDFHIRPAADEYVSPDAASQDSKIIRLVPQKEQSQLQDIHVWVNRDSLIERIALRDQFDTVTTLILTAVSVDGLKDKNQASLEQLFSFTPPEGTEIIHQ